MEKKQRNLVGKIVKKSSAQTLKVRVERKSPHPLYGKVVATHKNYLVNCSVSQFEKAEVGQVVEIKECRPVSKLKHWELVSKV